MVTDAFCPYHDVPCQGWLVSTVNGTGTKQWFVRFELGGLYPRRVGPFHSQRAAEKYYNETVREFLNDLVWNPDVALFIEDTLGSAYLKEKVSS